MVRAFSFGVPIALLASASTVRAVDDGVPFLSQYCIHCHGPEKQKGDVAFDKIAGISAGDWLGILDVLESGEMPPEDEKQPSPSSRQAMVLWVEQQIRNAGEFVDPGRRLHPSRGNWIDHEALFSARTPAPETATAGRLWRLTDRGYEEFIQGLNSKYRLGIRTYGHHRIRAPWELAPKEGFRDYASLHRIGEPEIEHHLRNATRVARLMVERLPKTRLLELAPLHELLRAGKSRTPEQIQLATETAIRGILGRPPVSAAETRRYAEFLSANLDSLEAEAAVEQLLVAILFHPEVMYRIETSAKGDKRALMPPRELARSLAHALTDREPDAALLAAAEEGEFSRREVREQVRRILADREIEKTRVLRFFQEYFGYTSAIQVFKDDTTQKAAGLRPRTWHPNFFVADADNLVRWVLERDRDVLAELLTTSKTFALTGDTKWASNLKTRGPDKPFTPMASTALAVYELDIERPAWTDQRPFDLPPGHRMGILTHPAWLIAHSTNFDNHAIRRGHWIRERLLGGKIPEVPVTVDAQLPDEPEHTLRHRMRVTREKYCWRCHQRMDPLGLPFEQFDHFGQFRTTELGEPVDTTGAVTDSHDAGLDGAVSDPFVLIRKLAASERVEQVFVRHVFRYFLGRNETLADGPVLVDAHRAYAENDGSMNALVTSLLSSDAFLFRTSLHSRLP